MNDEDVASQKATIKFVGESGKSLYDWCLEETFEDEKKQKFGNDFIPFLYSVGFNAHNLKYSFCLQNDRFSSDKNKKVVSRERISGDLVTAFEDEHIDIKMFGSKNPVGEMTLGISKISSAGVKREQCKVRAFDELETEDSNFREYVEPSSMHIDILLNDKNFNSLVAAIQSDSIDALHLGVRNVVGFYHNWTPTIHSGGIKILDKIEKVIFDKNVTVNQKKFIRAVGKETCEFDLSIHKTTLKKQGNVLDKLNDDYSDEDDDEEKNALSLSDIKILTKTHFKSLKTISNTLLAISIILVISFFLK
ncbi:hypothetical protein OAH98_00730 [Methylophilaceae bacterium]|nr:hypothetical protein [Methylophilaceae bacterium]